MILLVNFLVFNCWMRNAIPNFNRVRLASTVQHATLTLSETNIDWFLHTQKLYSCVLSLQFLRSSQVCMCIYMYIYTYSIRYHLVETMVSHYVSVVPPLPVAGCPINGWLKSPIHFMLPIVARCIWLSSIIWRIAFVALDSEGGIKPWLGGSNISHAIADVHSCSMRLQA